MKIPVALTAGATLMFILHGCSDATPTGKGPYLGDMKWINLPAGVTKLTSADLAGRAVMMEFWATW